MDLIMPIIHTLFAIFCLIALFGCLAQHKIAMAALWLIPMSINTTFIFMFA